jgi:hypothetical protein
MDMVSFYDPRDREDQSNVEQILSTEGIEYCTRQQTGPGITPQQILVAEEDLPKAEALMLRR